MRVYVKPAACADVISTDNVYTVDGDAVEYETNSSRIKPNLETNCYTTQHNTNNETDTNNDTNNVDFIDENMSSGIRRLKADPLQTTSSTDSGQYSLISSPYRHGKDPSTISDIGADYMKVILTN